LQDALFVDTCNLLNVEITEESNDQLDTLFDYIFNEGSCFFSDRFEVVDDGDKVAPTKNDKKSGRSKKQL
jgi:hypothetical protein